jgi:hypothetical protein
VEPLPTAPRISPGHRIITDNDFSVLRGTVGWARTTDLLFHSQRVQIEPSGALLNFLSTAPVSHQKRPDRDASNAIKCEQKFSKINEAGHFPTAHNGLIAGRATVSESTTKSIVFRPQKIDHKDAGSSNIKVPICPGPLPIHNCSSTLRTVLLYATATQQPYPCPRFLSPGRGPRFGPLCADHQSLLINSFPTLRHLYLVGARGSDLGPAD